MKVLLLLLAAVVSIHAKPRPKREAYSLPDGADIIVGPIKTNFNCFNDGYYADVDNNCQIFHVCHSVQNLDGSMDQQHYSFLCGNQTLFNQLSLTCATPEEAIPCQEAPSFFYLNDRLRTDDPKMYFLNDDDIQRAVPLVPALYGHAIRSGDIPAPAINRPRG